MLATPMRGEVEANLHAVASRVAHCGQRLRQQHDQRDHDTDRGRWRADGADSLLDRRCLDLGEPDDRDERDNEQREARKCSAAGGRRGVLFGSDADRQEIVAMPHSPHHHESPTPRRRGGRECQLRQRNRAPGALVVKVGRRE